MSKLIRTFVLLYVGLCAFNMAAGLEWPVFRDSVYKPLGNSYGQYQCYGEGCYPYMHTGIDIMAPTGTPVYAVKAGYVKAVLTIAPGADAYWRVVIADSSGTGLSEAFMYAHMDQWSIPVTPGQYVEEGQYIGDVVYFPYHDFNHLHFSKIRFQGTIPDWQNNWYDWEFIGNPLDDLINISDPDAPVIENAYNSQKFAFCENQSSIYFSEGEILIGDVDIISRIYDYINEYEYKVTPYQVEYRIDDNPWTVSFSFWAEIGPYGQQMEDFTRLIYKDDDVCDTKGDYDFREYYFIVTNTDGDSVIELNDNLGAWPTADYNNGEHKVYVRAYDRAGNSVVDSMTVTVANFFSLEGIAQLSDAVPQPNEGIVVTVLADSQADTTDVAGSFSITEVGGGNQVIEISRRGFETVDTVMMMNQNRQLEVTLVPGGYVAGDANCDGEINVGDVVYIINYVFKGGPAPIPYIAGNANGDAEVNIGDAVYLINYIFNGGPPPVEL